MNSSPNMGIYRLKDFKSAKNDECDDRSYKPQQTTKSSFDTLYHDEPFPSMIVLFPELFLPKSSVIGFRSIFTRSPMPLKFSISMAVIILTFSRKCAEANSQTASDTFILAFAVQGDVNGPFLP